MFINFTQFVMIHIINIAIKRYIKLNMKIRFVLAKHVL
jgi:hypothetical protein